MFESLQEIVVQDDAADLFCTFSQQHSPVQCMLCVFPQPTGCQSSEQPPFDVRIFKNNFLAYSFSDCSRFRLLSFFYVFFNTFSPFTLASSLSPLHALILVRPHFEEYMLFLSIKTQYGFFYGRAPEETYED